LRERRGSGEELSGRVDEVEAPVLGHAELLEHDLLGVRSSSPFTGVTERRETVGTATA
jgi:hypothetical protein